MTGILPGHINLHKPTSNSTLCTERVCKLQRPPKQIYGLALNAQGKQHGKEVVLKQSDCLKFEGKWQWLIAVITTCLAVISVAAADVSTAGTLSLPAKSYYDGWALGFKLKNAET